MAKVLVFMAKILSQKENLLGLLNKVLKSFILCKWQALTAPRKKILCCTFHEVNNFCQNIDFTKVLRDLLNCRWPWGEGLSPLATRQIYRWKIPLVNLSNQRHEEHVNQSLSFDLYQYFGAKVSCE